MQECPPPNNDDLTLAEVVGVYGVKGWVKLRSRLEETDLLIQLPKLYLCKPTDQAVGDRVPVTVESVRQQGKSLIAKFVNIDDRTAAEALRGQVIGIPAASFPAPDAGDFYWRDLVGLAVWCREAGSRVLLGDVDRLLETGANDVLVVVPTDQSIDDKEHLIPWILNTVIVEVDLEGKRIEVDWYVDA